MKRRTILITAIVLMICMLVCVLCACGDDDIPSGVPINWQAYLDEVATSLADDISRSDDVVSVSLTGNAVFGENAYNLTLRANYDKVNGDNSNFALILKNANDVVVVSILSTNKDTYIDIAQNSYVANAKLKLQETSVFDLSAYKSGTEAESAKEIFLSLGKVFFQNADVDAAKSKYTFNINGAAVGERLYEYFMAATVGQEEIVNVVLSILDINEVSELFSLLNDIGGQINFHMSEGSITKVDSENMTFNGKSSSIDLELRLKNEYDDTIEAMFPTSDAGYKVTKVGSTALDGSISLISSVGDKYAVKYDLSMNTNVDLLKLIYNDFDLDSLGDDNFLHFRLSHKCGDGCTEYCKSRLENACGAILDIAFSPKHFGTTNMYICLNLRAILSTDFVNEIALYDRSVSSSSIPEYGMIVLPASNLRGDNAFLRMLFQAYSMMMGIEVGESMFVNLQGLRDDLSNDKIASVVLDNMLESEQFQVDTLKIKVDQNIYGQSREYDIYKEVVYLKDYDESAVKSFSTIFGSDYTAYSWEYEKQKSAKFGNDTYALNNIYDISGQNLLHGANDSGEYVPMSDHEADDLIGSALKLQYTGYSGAVRETYCEIVDVIGLDINCFDTQSVTLLVRYPNMFDYAFEFAYIAENILVDVFGGGSEAFVQQVQVRIRLAKEQAEGAFDFYSADINKNYRLTYNSYTSPELLNATAVIRYENGLEKQIAAIGESSAVTVAVGLFSRTYSITDWGKITVRFHVAGRNIERYFNVEKPDSFEFRSFEAESEMGQSCYVESFVSLIANYGSDKVPVRLSLKDFYINNISLDASAAEWEHFVSYTNKYVVFIKSNDYTVQVKKQDIVFGEFTLGITSTSTKTPSYQYNIGNEPRSVVLVGAGNEFTGTITNRTHGDGEDISYTFDIKVYKYYATETGVSNEDASASEYTILEFSIGSTVSDNGGLQIALPSMIRYPINVSMNIKFNEKGIFLVELRQDSGRIYSFVISVI